MKRLWVEVDLAWAKRVLAIRLENGSRPIYIETRDTLVVSLLDDLAEAMKAVAPPEHFWARINCWDDPFE